MKFKLFAWIGALALWGCNSPTPTDTETPIVEANGETAFMEPLQITSDTPVVVSGQPILMPDLFYLTHPSIPDSAKLLYTGSIGPFDGEYTFQVFEALDTVGDTLLPFYFYTTLVISQHSDGAVSEMLGLTMHGFALHHPKKLKALLDMPNKIIGSTNREIWLEWTLTENGIGNDGYEWEAIATFEEGMLENSPDEETVAFTKLYVEDLKKMLTRFQQP